MNFKNMDIYNEVAQKACQCYRWETPFRIELHHRSENATYLVLEAGTKKPQGVLRVSRPGYHSREEILGELQWMQHLKKNQVVRLADVMLDQKGQPFQEILVAETVYICVVFSYLEGQSPDQTNEMLRVNQFYQIGQIAARLHRDSYHWKEAENVCRPCWDFDGMLGRTAFFGDWQKIDTLSQGDRVMLTQAVQKIAINLRKLGKDKNCYGLIHADLRYANLLVDHNVFSVIDFDDCGFGWYLYDLAASISFIETNPLVRSYIKSWLKGYRSITTLTKKEMSGIPTFIMIRRIQLMTWLYFHQDSDPFATFYHGYQCETINLAKMYINLHKDAYSS